MPIRPTLITEQETAKDTITPQFYEKSFRQKNLFDPPIFPFKISPSSEPLIQTDVLPVKTIETFGNEEKNDKPAVIYDGDILDYIASKSWNYDEAVAVMMCENFNANVYVISKSGDIGLFQINLKAHWSEIPGETREEKIAWLQNPLNNVDFAFSLYQVKKWGDWYMSYPCHNLK